MKIIIKSIIISILFFTLPYTIGVCKCAELEDIIKKGMITLSLEKGSSDLGVLTNAGYVTLNEKFTNKYIDAITELTGCTIGKVNLLFFNERPKNTLFIALGNRKTLQSVIIKFDGKHIVTENISLKKVDIKDPEYFWKAEQGICGRQAYSILSILSGWFNYAPYDFLRCAEIHGHICPGLFFGYTAAKGIQANFPLQAGEKYYFIASPNECMDDAIQMILGLTPGKRTLIVKPLSKGQLKEIEGKKVVGILIKWSDNDFKGQGIIVAVDMDAINVITKLDKSMGRNLKVLAAMDLINWLPEYPMFFSIIKKFPISAQLKEQLTKAGVNPYELLNMTN